MIRRLLLFIGVVLSGAAAVQLADEVRYLVHGSKTVRTLLSGGNGPAVVYIVQPEDCLGSGARVKHWTAAHEAGPVPVRIAVVGKELSPRQRDLLARNDVRLPVGSISFRDASIVAEKLGYSATPFAVLFDHRGRVAATWPAGRAIPPEMVRQVAAGR